MLRLLISLMACSRVCHVVSANCGSSCAGCGKHEITNRPELRFDILHGVRLLRIDEEGNGKEIEKDYKLVEHKGKGLC